MYCKEGEEKYVNSTLYLKQFLSKVRFRLFDLLRFRKRLSSVPNSFHPFDPSNRKQGKTFPNFLVARPTVVNTKKIRFQTSGALNFQRLWWHLKEGFSHGVVGGLLGLLLVGVGLLGLLVSLLLVCWLGGLGGLLSSPPARGLLVDVGQGGDVLVDVGDGLGVDLSGVGVGGGAGGLVGGGVRGGGGGGAGGGVVGGGELLLGGRDLGGVGQVVLRRGSGDDEGEESLEMTNEFFVFILCHAWRIVGENVNSQCTSC